MSFQVHALPGTEFEPLFSMSDSELQGIGATRVVARDKPGYPCRVSLRDADVGETLILVNFEHQPGDSPYRSRHAIFVRENAEQAYPALGTVPELIESRLISVRAFNSKHYMVTADVVDGSELVERIPKMFGDDGVAYLHLHYAQPGCFAATVVRAESEIRE